jgi:hypothetical protein
MYSAAKRSKQQMQDKEQLKSIARAKKTRKNDYYTKRRTAVLLSKLNMQ